MKICAILLLVSGNLIAESGPERMHAWHVFVRDAAMQNPDFVVQLAAEIDVPGTVSYKVPKERRAAFWAALSGRIARVGQFDAGEEYWVTGTITTLMKAHGISGIGISLMPGDRVLVKVYGNDLKLITDFIYDQKAAAEEAAFLLVQLHLRRPNKTQ